MTSGGDYRVSVSNTVRKLIYEVKKTLGSVKYTDDFIYATLKDCDLNVNETSRRLKMIHDIKEIAGKHSVEDVYTMLKECNMDPNEAAQRLLYIDTFHEVKKKQDRRKSITNDTSEEFKRTGGNQIWGARGGRGTSYSSKAFDDGGGGRNSSSGKEYGVTNRLEKVSRLTLPVNSGKENNVKHVADSAAISNGTQAVSNGTPAVSNGSYIHKLAPKPSAGCVKDVSSHTPDPVMVSSQNVRHTCAVGSITCEIVKRSGFSESNSRMCAGVKFSADQVGAVTVPVISEAADSYKPKQQISVVVVEDQPFELLQPPLLSIQDSSNVIDPNQDNKPIQLLNEPLKGTTSEHKTVSINKTHPVPKGESELKIPAAKPDAALEKLTLYSHQPVIFPDHLQVPENYKSQFTFGSLDAIFYDPGPLSVPECGVVTEPSLSNQNVPTAAQEGEIQDNLLPDLSKPLLPSQDNISSDPAVKHDMQTKIEMTLPDGGFQNPALQNTMDYNYGFMPPLMGPHFVQLDVPELQNGSSPVSSTLGPTPVTQDAVVGQTSIALSPPLFPYYRQPYPNYFPYNPYFPHMYLPHNVHLLNHGVFPQQPPTGNVHMQAGVKIPATSQFKQGSNEDRIASQAKDSTIHPSVQQGEDPQVWAPVAGRDAPNILPNYFYNFPRGQHMAFSPLQAGLYYSSQTMTAQSTVQPLVYPSYSSFGPVETMVQPLTSYQQPQHEPQTELPDRETS